MTRLEPNNLKIIFDLIAIALMAGMLFGLFVSKRKKAQPADRILIALFVSNIVSASLDAINSVIEANVMPGKASLMMAGHTLHNAAVNLVVYLILMYLLRSFESKRIENKLFKCLLAVPVLLAGLLLIANIFGGFMFRVDSISLSYIHSSLYFLLYIPMGIYTLLSVLLLIRRNRSLALILGILVMLRVHFMLVLNNVNMTEMALALTITLLVLCMRIHGILIQIGSILGLLFLLVMLVIGNYVTCSAFTSYLMSERDENLNYIELVMEELKDYTCLPALIEYWKAHPDEMDPGIFENVDDEFLKRWDEMLSYIAPGAPSGSGEITHVSTETFESLPPDIKKMYANACYYYIAEEFEMSQARYDLTKLFMVQKYGDEAIALFDSRRRSDGSYRIGGRFTMERLIEVRERFFEATRETGLNWSWLTYSDSDEFGIFSALEEFGTGDGAIMICNMIPFSEIQQNLGYVAGFRVQALVFLLLIGVLIILLIRFTILRPLVKVQNSVLAYQEDKDADKVQEQLAKVSDRNEIGVLAGQFTALTREMERYTAQIEKMAGEREKSRVEMHLSTTIQMNAMPVDFPDRPEFSLRASMTPARNVGGDFYDFFQIDEDHLAMVIADVSDKGMPAALFMMASQIMINERTLAGGTPAVILADVNEKLIRKYPMSEMFVTVWLGILEISSGKMICANAGHEYPVIRSGDEGFRIYKDRHGMVVGGIEGVKYHDYELLLKSGDAIFVYTDGVPEANDPAGEFFGPERMEAALREENSTMDPAVILQRVTNSLAEFVAGAEQFDDTTMLCLTYRGPQACGEDKA